MNSWYFTEEDSDTPRFVIIYPSSIRSVYLDSENMVHILYSDSSAEVVYPNFKIHEDYFYTDNTDWRDRTMGFTLLAYIWFAITDCNTTYSSSYDQGKKEAELEYREEELNKREKALEKLESSLNKRESNKSFFSFWR